MMIRVPTSLQCLYREPRVSDIEICMADSKEVRTEKSQAYFALTFALKLPKISEGKRAIIIITAIIEFSGISWSILVNMLVQQ